MQEMQESRVRSWSGRAPGVGNTTHSNTLACTIPWAEEAGWTTGDRATKNWTVLSDGTLLLSASLALTNKIFL